MKANIYIFTIFVFVFIGCEAHRVERENILPKSFQESSKSSVEVLKLQSPFLKAHMKNGSLYVFDSWTTDDAKSIISGNATLYDFSRQQIGKNQYTIGLDSVSLLETNVIKNSGAATALTVFTGISAAITVFCITNPKACFGSCPTFYVSDGDSLHLMAEGFSSSVAPSLEATDIDALYHAKSSHGELSIEMRNEALETHVVRQVDLLAIPRQNNFHAFVDQHQQFWRTTAPLAPISAVAPEGNCLPLLLQFDGKERFSLADDSYLGTKEEIDLEFEIDHIEKSHGLLIASRQTLLPTYLFYQALAYMGNDAGHWLAEIERSNNFGRDQRAIEHIVGGIEVLQWTSENQWEVVGTINENGPLASEIHLIPLNAVSSHKFRLKLRMTKGTWRIDYVALTELVGHVTPLRLHPYVVLRDSQEDSNARSTLLDSNRVLVTLPGDCYTLKYKLQDDQSTYDFFLESRGYYLEWIRKEWIEEENPLLLAEMFFNPECALKRLAPDFKRVEAQMEKCFWRSKYAKP